jgi:hypothetical protein
MRTLLAAALLVPALALAQASVPAPRLLPYQGRLLRADGTPETGAPRLAFRVYDAASDGTLLWSEQQSVPLTNGFYAVFLGSVTTFSAAIFDGHDRWLGVTVEDEAELSPRQQIASVAYAFMATSALQATIAAHADSATTAGRAAAADSAATATYATTAGRASTADSATTAGTAASATTAANAAHATRADTATSLSGGTVQATTVTSSGHVSANGNVSANQNLGVGGNANVEGDMRIAGAIGAATMNATGSVNAPTVNAGILNADAVLHVPGSVVGGVRLTQACTLIICSYTCTAWGDGWCEYSAGVGTPVWDCTGGVRPAGYVRGIPREFVGGGLCIQP